MKKKIIISLVSIALILSLIFIPQIIPAPISVKLTVASHSDTPPLLIAHRGYSCKFPQNTLPAIKEAINKGYYGCEFDIHLTKDNIWVINHDESIDNMTDGSGNIADLTFQKIQQFNVDNGKGIKDFQNLKLSSIDDILPLFQNTMTRPIIEIKGYKKEKLNELIEKLKENNLTDKAVIISFDENALKEIRRLNSKIEIMLLASVLTKENVDLCIKENFGLDINGKKISKAKEALTYAQEKDIEIAAWTIDSTFRADYLHKKGINKITSNRIYPE